MHTDSEIAQEHTTQRARYTMHEHPTARNELLERPGDTAKFYSHRKSVEASTRRNCLLFGKSADTSKMEAAHSKQHLKSSI